MEEADLSAGERVGVSVCNLACMLLLGYLCVGEDFCSGSVPCTCTSLIGTRPPQPTEGYTPAHHQDTNSAPIAGVSLLLVP